MKRITSLLLAIVLFAGLVLVGAPTVHAESDMKTSDALVEVLKQEEGFSAKPYRDYGQYTVGYGTRCPDDMLEEYMENGITEEEADTLLRNYLAKTENTINKKFIDKNGLTLNQNQFDALISFTYNCGTNWINESNGIFKSAIIDGATGSELICAFSLWCSAGGQILPGLVRRRLCEANMFLNGEYSITAPEDYCFVYFNPNGGKVSYRIQGYHAEEGVAPAYEPTYSGREFLGWYTSKTGGEEVTVLTKELSGDTLYARWESADGEKEEETTEKKVKVKVTASDVNLRKGPGTNYSIVGTATKGDKLTITETANGSGYEWGKAGSKWIVLEFTNYAKVMEKLEEESEDTKPEETEPEETEPEETEPEETKPEETEPEETKPEETEPEETKPEETEPEETEPEETEPEETEPEEKPKDEKVTGRVKANGGLAVREGPGTGYGAKEYLADGTKVTITERKRVGSMTWGKIKSGWISMTYVVLDKDGDTPEESKPKEEEKLTGKVKADGGLAVRSGAGRSYDVRSYLPNGSKVTITKQKDADGMTWGKVSGGWISMSYVVLDKDGDKPEDTKPEETKPEETEPEEKPKDEKVTGKVKADGGLAVRKGAGTSYAIVKYLSNGQQVTITEQTTVKGTVWGKVSGGWISMDYVVLDKTEASEEDESEEVKKTVKADCLRVRKSASTSAEIVGYYYEGAIVTILETKDADGISWGRTAKGWISMQYVK